MARLTLFFCLAAAGASGAMALQSGESGPVLRDGPTSTEFVTSDLAMDLAPLSDTALARSAGATDEREIFVQFDTAPAAPVPKAESGDIPVASVFEPATSDTRGEDAAAPPQRRDGPMTLTMSGNDGLAFAERLFEAGDYDAAGAILEELAGANAPGVDQTQVAFLTGMIAVQREDFKTAVEIFRDILDERPDIVRVRLELARALFALKRDQAAAYHFRLALASDLPPEAQANIRVFLHLIEQRKVWRLNANIGAAPDSNISAGPKDQTVELFGLPFELDDSARERSGIGLTTSLSGEYFPRIGRDWRMELRGGGSISDYENIQFDDIFLYGEAGPRLMKKGFSASVLGAFSRRFFGGDGYNTSIGGKVSVTKGLTSRTRLNLRFSGARVRYDIDFGRDGPVFSAGAVAQHAINRVSTGQIGFTATRERTSDTVLRNTQYLLNASYRRELPFGVTAQVGPDLYYRDFDNFDPLNNNVRHDWTIGGSVFLTKRDWRFYGFAPVFSYQFLKNNSNADRFDYTRHRANVGLTRTF